MGAKGKIVFPFINAGLRRQAQSEIVGQARRLSGNQVRQPERSPYNLRWQRESAGEHVDAGPWASREKGKRQHADDDD